MDAKKRPENQTFLFDSTPLHRLSINHLWGEILSQFYFHCIDYIQLFSAWLRLRFFPRVFHSFSIDAIPSHMMYILEQIALQNALFSEPLYSHNEFYSISIQGNLPLLLL